MAGPLGRRAYPLWMRVLIGGIGTHSCVLGLLLLFEPRLMMRLFGFPASIPIFFPSQSGIFLLILGVVYLRALLDPVFVRAIVISKAFAVVFLFTHAALLAAPPIIWGMLAGDSTMLVTLSGALLWYRRLTLTAHAGGAPRHLQRRAPPFLRKENTTMAERVTKIGRTTIHLELTPEQQAQIRRALGNDVRALELTPEQLEERLAPGGCPISYGGQGTGH